MKAKKRTLAVLVAVVMVLTATMIGTAAFAEGDYNFKYIGSGENYEPLTHVVNIGILKGSWFEMGTQYGERLAYDVLRNTDLEWGKSLAKYNNDAATLKKDLATLNKQLELFSPQTAAFMRGIASGAAEELYQSKYNGQASAYERIFNLNASIALVPPPKPAAPVAVAVAEDGCNSFWIGREGTVEGRAIATFHSQGGNLGWDNHARKVIFVAIPKDPKARIVWSFSSSGCIALGGVMFNDAGVFHGLHASDDNKLPESKAYGVEHNVGRFHAMFYANSAEEFADIMIYGTPEYRKATGRKTLLRTRGVNLHISDANTSIMLELTATRHAKRYPGQHNEPGIYITQSNHNHMDFSYDENDKLTKVPMTKFAQEVYDSSSYHRFWSPFWTIAKVYGTIDLNTVLRELTASHDVYDADGTKRPYMIGHTFCTHKYDAKNDNPGGSHAIAVGVPETLEIYQLPYWPCRFTNSSWQYFNLNDYKLMRAKGITDPYNNF